MDETKRTPPRRCSHFRYFSSILSHSVGVGWVGGTCPLSRQELTLAMSGEALPPRLHSSQWRSHLLLSWHYSHSLPSTWSKKKRSSFGNSAMALKHPKLQPNLGLGYLVVSTRQRASLAILSCAAFPSSFLFFSTYLHQPALTFRHKPHEDKGQKQLKS